MTPQHRRNLHAELERWKDEPARSWVPKVGDVLVGELVRYSRGEGAYGPAWIAHVGDERTGEPRAVWLFHHVLLEEFKRLRPQPSERVGICRLEDGGQDERRYRRFPVVVDREGVEQLPDLFFDALGLALDAVVAELERLGLKAA